MDNYLKIFKVVGWLVATLFVVGGCGKSEVKQAATQVVAKVNSAEISVHQLNDLLARVPNVTNENANQVKHEILDKLIDQQLAVEQAEANKLDRNPNVMRAIEAAKRDVLARAYYEQIASALMAAPANEARKYYADHPELFSARRIYSLQELQIGPAALPTVQESLSRNQSFQEIVSTLDAKKLKYTASAGVRAAEQIPLTAVAKLHSMKDGQTGIVDSQEGPMVVHIVASQSQPVSEEQALPKIQAFLTNQRRGEAVEQNIKSIRGKAKIERLGEFAQATTVSTNAPAPAAADPASVAKVAAGSK
jgi:EpsD family peptidyl-prolyl cis-trans isomerase